MDGLCLSHYLSAPALSWDAMLNIKEVELQLVPDLDMFMFFFEKSLRGGVSYISNRYSKGNSKYLKSYNPKQKSKHIIYLDTNNLYGFAMSNFLPINSFKRIDLKEPELKKYTS